MADNVQRDKPTLVLLHGWGLNQGVWQGIAPMLQKHCRLLTPDLPGFGHNTQFPDGYALKPVLAQIAEAIPQQSLVCGWSLGGLLAIALARYYPDKVRQLGLIAASPSFLAKEDWPGMAAGVMQQFSQALSQQLEQTIGRFLAIQAMGSASAKADIMQLKQVISAYPVPTEAAVTGALRLLAEQDLRADFAAICQPIAGCYGLLDSLVPVSIVPLLQQLQPDAHLTLVPHASHAPFISHQAELLSWFEQWLSRA
ncbi:pimeloyl-ACP methyl ester esterase BioH [Arsukibacterium sp.]|uniref:pimeloyl-ACP methyl ester esterase BioH n=1 Tax=Arsukibacterium sp. TaxID=1977258 RepID=UPI002FDA2FEE